jgi:transposase InsO family protein
LELLNLNNGFFENVRLITSETEPKENNCFPELQVGHLSRDDRSKVSSVLKDFQDVFSKTKMDIGKTHLLEHRVDTGDSPPIAFSPRRIPVALEEKVDKLVEELLLNDIIRPSESPWNAPIVIVAKKDGDIRMCVDYRKLNAVTKRAVYPIPATQQLLDCLSGSQYFSTLDLSQGYHQIPVAEDDIPKTAFATRKGQFEYKRMPFGLTTAPATFQRLMHIVLKNENWEKCLIYLDDILIFGRSVEEHLERLKAVLQRIREAGLKLSPSKCFFMQKEVTYLGHIITSTGIRTDPKKIDKVKEWPHPKTVKQLRSFLGFCGYYRRFIKDYAEIVRPLESLSAEICSGLDTNKRRSQDITFKWLDAHESAFTSLKLALTTAPVLSYPNETGKFILDTDASNTGLGAVLSQIQNGVEHVIAYASRKLTKSEKRYCVTRKELLAVYYFVKHFRHYLFGRRFLVRTDHKALIWMLNWKKPNTSQYCLWKAELEMYDLEIIHRPGNKHSNADALSRLPNCQQCELKHENPVNRRYVKIFNSVTSSGGTIVDEKSHHLIMRMTEEPLPHPDWQTKNDPEVGVIMALMRAGKLSQQSIPHAVKTGNANIKKLWLKRENLRIRGDALYLMNRKVYRLVVPVRERKKLITNIHLAAGHSGVDKVIYIAQGNYYWPGMNKEIQQRLKSCPECQFAKGKSPRDKAPFQPTLVNEPFERIAMDISGPFHPSKHGYRYILAIIDYFSKYPVLIPLKRIDAETIARKTFQYWISVFGAPQIIHTDRGSNFESELFKEQCKILGIQKTRTSPYYPQSDGLVERLFRTIKPMISATVQSHRVSWCQALPIVEMGIRSSVQATTGLSPSEIIFGKKMRLPLSWQHPSLEKQQTTITATQYIRELQETLNSIHDQVKDHMQRAIQRQTDRYNYKKSNTLIKLGDKVLVKREGHVPAAFPKLKYCGPYQVISKNNHWSYQLKDTTNGNIIDRNYNQLKRFTEKHISSVSNNRPQSRQSHSQITSVQSNSAKLQIPNSAPKRSLVVQSAGPSPTVFPSTVVSSRRYPLRERVPPKRI